MKHVKLTWAEYAALHLQTRASLVFIAIFYVVPASTFWFARLRFFGASGLSVRRRARIVIAICRPRSRNKQLIN
jgi:hypothetical protein